ncbi:nuclear transport factor 2 family protein [Niabella ginsengisoli]|uniref:Ester cyclase n=1 Tax=Niabella ginsengisoli TaxID=522298 RepID=A0ABS9SKJ5_9BACT|nr:nuclear transport factor 2 family protein [Niabella ginsengisoli]MCH5598891.1 ester cyclase [Niabella ginsengisoli]
MFPQNIKHQTKNKPLIQFLKKANEKITFISYPGRFTFSSMQPTYGKPASNINNRQLNIRLRSTSQKNGAQFHINFSAGEFDKNGQLVTEDIYVNSNNAILVGRDNFVTRIKRYDGPFPGMHLTDRIVIVEDNIAAVHYILQGEQKGKYGDLDPTGIR